MCVRVCVREAESERAREREAERECMCACECVHMYLCDIHQININTVVDLVDQLLHDPVCA